MAVICAIQINNVHKKMCIVQKVPNESWALAVRWLPFDDFTRLQYLSSASRVL